MSEENGKKKKKQKPKAGKVVRLRKKTWEVVARKIRKNETVDDAIRRLAGITDANESGGRFFILPDSGIVLKNCHSLAEARGQAVLIAVRKRKTDPERPLEVRVVAS